jgi:hypothetical protein
MAALLRFIVLSTLESEYWSGGILGFLIPEPITPILHHSNPILLDLVYLPGLFREANNDTRQSTLERRRSWR